MPGSLDEDAPSPMLIGLLMFVAIIGVLAVAAMASAACSSATARSGKAGSDWCSRRPGCSAAWC
ncbi:hypothetical protein XthCFBP4691_18575 [Xanthomonas theicola]|uniref:Uncharacterized protein n=2 Tax=Xanthomonas theicola TaxID=56464 RepID=A0A2S6ZB39_9XANT|nr:hypothetical protein [Xanthomonas theicola]PPT79671.1 hypothetical protein XthCFBP4691_18575 [Xanthomonas theicola]QNH26552.1 hypothetical protein G4Q83_20030 [Xanthomonas theicola]